MPEDGRSGPSCSVCQRRAASISRFARSLRMTVNNLIQRGGGESRSTPGRGAPAMLPVVLGLVGGARELCFFLGSEHHEGLVVLGAGLLARLHAPILPQAAGMGGTDATGAVCSRLPPGIDAAASVPERSHPMIRPLPGVRLASRTSRCPALPISRGTRAPRRAARSPRDRARFPPDRRGPSPARTRA